MEKLELVLTDKERLYYENIYGIADKGQVGRLEGRQAASFLKKSGLNKEQLKEIWVISARTNMAYLLKDEFFIALRLIALAQNNMEVSEKAIGSNSPSPPLPRFNLEMDTSSVSIISHSQSYASYSNIPNENPSESKYEASKDIWDHYTKLFNKYKDKPKSISLHRAFNVFAQARLNQDVVRNVVKIMPMGEKTEINNAEFNTIVHLVNLAKDDPRAVPVTLPNILKLRIDRESKIELSSSNQSINNNIEQDQYGSNVSNTEVSTASNINSKMQNSYSAENTSYKNEPQLQAVNQPQSQQYESNNNKTEVNVNQESNKLNSINRYKDLQIDDTSFSITAIEKPPVIVKDENDDKVDPERIKDYEQTNKQEITRIVDSSFTNLLDCKIKQENKLKSIGDLLQENGEITQLESLSDIQSSLGISQTKSTVQLDHLAKIISDILQEQEIYNKNLCKFDLFS